MRVATWVESERSTGWALPPSSAASGRRTPSVRATSATVAPAPAKRRARDSPIPRDAPVINIRLPDSSISRSYAAARSRGANRGFSRSPNHFLSNRSVGQQRNQQDHAGVMGAVEAVVVEVVVSGRGVLVVGGRRGDACGRAFGVGVGQRVVGRLRGREVELGGWAGDASRRGGGRRLRRAAAGARVGPG